MSRSPMAAARARLDAVTKNHEGAVAAAAAAHEILDAALKDRDTAAARLERSRNRYRDFPTHPNAKSVGGNTRSLELAELRTDNPRAAAEQADRAVEIAASAVLDAEREIAGLERIARIAELKIGAAPEAFRDRSRGHFDRLFALLTECEDLVSAIVGEHSVSVAAAEELERLGEPTEPLGTHHLITELLLHEAERTPGTLEFIGMPAPLVERSYRIERGGCDLIAIVGLLAAIRASAKAGETMRIVEPDRTAVLRARLDVLRNTAATAEAVRAAMAIESGAAVTVAPEPRSLIGRLFGGATETLAS